MLSLFWSRFRCAWLHLETRAPVTRYLPLASLCRVDAVSQRLPSLVDCKTGMCLSVYACPSLLLSHLLTG